VRAGLVVCAVNAVTIPSTVALIVRHVAATASARRQGVLLTVRVAATDSGGTVASWPRSYWREPAANGLRTGCERPPAP
jgi:hypothetical protein